jgi:hypothetical protein
MSNREKSVYVFTLVSGLAMLMGAWAEPPQGWWRVILYAVIPLMLALVSLGRLLAGRARR